MLQKVIAIVGPTSSGKSALAVRLAKRFKGEVISADSRQVYKGLNIGTGKIKKREMRGIRHHLLDVASPKRTFTAHDFMREAQEAITMIYQSKKLPIVAGGTGFYIDALLGRISLPDVPADPKLRARLERKPLAALLRMLKGLDPKRAKTVEPHNKRRIVRAIEIALSAQKTPETRSLYKTLWIGIAPPFADLERAIRSRLRERIRKGLIPEGARLRKQGLSYKRMRQLGLEYGALADLLEEMIDRKEFEERLYRHIRRYAKKQLAYWKRNRSIMWFDPSDYARIKKTVTKFLATK
ncbi:MAG: tRNA (adenosine(37)-N6)-dimethylallyltransferase MiaA [Candidatus Kaiserbacteria bacterium]|nr:MAG: tRNA (adenosine(37)-N6)-dimethylallyltransferase MiaA [Candidatus Kaiserbacteria bacterium]